MPNVMADRSNIGGALWGMLFSKSRKYWAGAIWGRKKNGAPFSATTRPMHTKPGSYG